MTGCVTPGSPPFDMGSWCDNPNLAGKNYPFACLTFVDT